LWLISGRIVQIAALDGYEQERLGLVET
jgi:hypothetical protein